MDRPPRISATVSPGVHDRRDTTSTIGRSPEPVGRAIEIEPIPRFEG